MHFESVKLPSYTKGEELFNTISHAAGIVLGVVAFILFWHKSTDTAGYAGALIYSLAIVTLYTGSTVYHALSPGLIKKFFRVVDHAVIYILIAGTSTTVMVVGILPHNKIFALIMMALSLVITVVGTVLTYADQERFKTVQMVLYMVLGWMCLVLIYPIYKYCENSTEFILCVVAGGIVYTVGTTFLALGKRKRYFHSIFHLFVLAGTLIHFFGIYLYLY